MWLFLQGKILHIGDNFAVDIIKAKEYGLDTFYVPSAISILNESALSSLIEVKEKEENILGLIIAKLFNSPFSLINEDNTVNINSLYDFGYCVFGPIMSNYLIELIKLVKTNSIDKICFLARDAYILKELYEFFINTFELKLDVDTLYLKISSRLIESVTLFNEKDINFLLDNRVFDGRFCDFLRIVFDIEIFNEDENRDKEIVSSIDKEKVKVWLKPYIEKILKQSEINRKNYLNYINQENLNCNLLVTDIGYTGRQQFYLEKLLKQSFYGFYVALEEDTKYNNGKMQGLYDTKLTSLFKVLEAVCVSNEGSYIKSIENGKFINDKKLKNQEYYEEKLEIIEGIKGYLLDIKNTYKTFNNINESKEIAQKIFNIAFSDNVKLNSKISDILFFDNPYSSARETKII